ncbi:hypothetical protein [Chitinimonas koreensis]|uniref:hypothetical protein n=1 Tax=Chitinimonas koreensis TaxID=356302 RepID=UPI000416C53F|nr:hypothetical protein [Chitinimonas koreensis]QNM96015.1 hypothetical protein H9L41_19685 [Chitinimonas koreensis]
MDVSIYLLTICLPLLTVLLVFGMRYLSAVQQAKLRFGHDEAHRQLAEQALAAQRETAAVVASIDANLADVRARLLAIEQILKAVE